MEKEESGYGREYGKASLGISREDKMGSWTYKFKNMDVTKVVMSNGERYPVVKDGMEMGCLR